MDPLCMDRISRCQLIVSGALAAGALVVTVMPSKRRLSAVRRIRVSR